MRVTRGLVVAIVVCFLAGLLAQPSRAEILIDVSAGYNRIYEDFFDGKPQDVTLGIGAHFGPRTRYQGDSKEDLEEMRVYWSPELYYFQEESGPNEITNLYFDLGNRVFTPAASFGKNDLYGGGGLSLLRTDIDSPAVNDDSWLFGFKFVAGWQYELAAKHRIFVETSYRGYLHHITGGIAGLSASDFNNGSAVVGYRLKLSELF